MSRWKPNARGRLERAAIELFAEQGFAETTVPQIAARAGLTTRTFYRHFADKREVLFVAEEELPALVAHIAATAPAGLAPLQLIIHALETVTTDGFEEQREYLRARHAVIQADKGLRERELRKVAILSDAMALGFRERGIDELTAFLAAHLAATAFNATIGRWLEQDGDRPLAAFVRDTIAALRAVAVEPAAPPGAA